VYTNAYDEEVFFPNHVTDEASKQELLDYLKDEAVQYRDIGVTTSDQIIALSTCENAVTDGRILLFGRLETGEQQ
jgi:sortase B